LLRRPQRVPDDEAGGEEDCCARQAVQRCAQLLTRQHGKGGPLIGGVTRQGSRTLVNCSIVAYDREREPRTISKLRACTPT
jgi:hypothetical protein